MIKNEEMVNVSKFDSVWTLYVLILLFRYWIKFPNIRHWLIFYRWVCCEITDDRQPFRTLISFKRKMDKYHFIGGNMSQSCLSWFHIRITWEHPSFFADCDDSESRQNFQTFTISSFFIAQWAIKSWIIDLPLSFLIP